MKIAVRNRCSDFKSYRAAHSHDFIGRKTRALSRLGALGYHPSLLPLHRGRDAIRWAVHMRVRCLGRVDGEYEGRPVHVLKLGEILETRNWP